MFYFYGLTESLLCNVIFVIYRVGREVLFVNMRSVEMPLHSFLKVYEIQRKNRLQSAGFQF